MKNFDQINSVFQPNQINIECTEVLIKMGAYIMT